MLRFILIVLVVANIGYFLVSRGDTSGQGERETQRVAQQIRPEMLQIRKPEPVVSQPPVPAETPPPTTSTATPVTPAPSAPPAVAPPARTEGDPSP
jgi:hypothetical protein